MLKNYFKIMWRNLVRSKVYSAINILGLATGLSACILIFLYIQDELSYDRHFSKSDRIYRVATEFNLQGGEDKFALSSTMLAGVMKKDFPEVEEATRIVKAGKQTIWIDEKAFNEENIYFADSTLFSVFDYDFLAGDPATALSEPYTIVLSEELARKFFGSAENATGRMLKSSKNQHKVTGVIRTRGQSHINASGFLAHATLDKTVNKTYDTGDWFAMSTYTFGLLRGPGQKENLEASLQNLWTKTIEPWVKEYKVNASITFHVQPLPEIHFINDFSYDFSPGGNKSYLYIFGFVAIFILLIACINYMNLATARSVRRAKEVGLRKVVGAHRWQLVRQFVSESVFITLLSVVLALMLAEVLLGAFNNLTDKSFSYTYFLDPEFLFALALLVLVVGILAGSYPAIFLSGFKPAEVLKSDKSPKGGSSLLRKTLVVAQFTISMLMIIGTLVVFSQMHYLKNTDLGFNKEQVLVIDIPGGDSVLVNRLGEIKQEFLNHPGVTKVATSAHIPGGTVGRRMFYSMHNGERRERTMSVMAVDSDFLDLMGIGLAEGRNFSSEIATDKDKFLINEAAVRYIGWDNPLSEKLSMGTLEFYDVIGVVNDFHFASLHNKIEPMGIILTPKSNGYMLLRVEPKNLASTISFVEEKWKAFDPKHPMEHFFLDENFDKQYRSEEKMLAVFGYFAGLTIFIACLGLFGLASFTAEQRTKEIGIRKVLGSSVSGIVVLLSKDFALLVLAAIILATPLAWYGMRHWLHEFAYRTEISLWLFLAAGLAAMVIAMLTVGLQAARAAMLDPVKTLRTE